MDRPRAPCAPSSSSPPSPSSFSSSLQPPSPSAPPPTNRKRISLHNGNSSSHLTSLLSSGPSPRFTKRSNTRSGGGLIMGGGGGGGGGGEGNGFLQPSPLQFNSIRKKRGAPLKSAVSGGLFLAPLAKPSKKEVDGVEWSIEIGTSDIEETRVSLIDHDRYTPYYRHYFLDKNHVIYIGSSTNSAGDHYILCVEELTKETLEGGVEIPPRRALVISSKNYTPTESPTIWALLPPSKKPLLKQLIASDLGPTLSESKLLRVDEPQIRKELAKLEGDMTQFSYKFGVMLCLEGQTTEEEMLQNNEQPEEFVEFLGWLGKTIDLKGFDGFSGGLDTRYGDTGNTSVYRKYQNIQVMYHVANMLPYDPQDEQQIARKKHIGNDVVVFIFMMGAGPFDPSSFVSEFNHVFIAVTKEKMPGAEDFGYRVNVVSRGGIHSISPPLPDPPILPINPKISEFLVVKAINSERAAMYAPKFSRRLDLVRQRVISNIVDTHIKTANKKKSLSFGALKKTKRDAQSAPLTHRATMGGGDTGLKKSGSFQITISQGKEKEEG